MKLEEINIKSYRSIVNQKIKVNESCIGLIGLNESGKTNVLNAIRSLSEDFYFSLKDKSKINNELPCIEFIFKFDKSEHKELNELVNKILQELMIIPYKRIIKKAEFERYVCKTYLEKSDDNDYDSYLDTECIFNVDIEDILFKPKKDTTISQDITIDYEGEKYHLYTLKLIPGEMLPEEYKEYYEKADYEYIYNEIERKLSSMLEKKIPSVIYWEYDPKYLIPSEITYDDFMKDKKPYDNSAPLYNVFKLSENLGIDSVEILNEKIQEWKTDPSSRRRDSVILTEDINKYIRGIWEEFDQNLVIELEEAKITILINDPTSSKKNFYEMEARSQGFKTFISFILTIAAEYENNSISNFILILDEPETHLHPSGVKFMRNELCKLSQNNYVFFATHSIFMIDRAKLERHIIVKKENESTILIPVERNTIIQEAILYEALGTTIDEFSISNKNIVFEGEIDLFLFNFYITKCLGKNNRFLEYELHDGGGTKNIYKFFKDKVIPKQSEWILVLDNDQAGQNLEKDIIQHHLNTSNTRFIYYSNKENFELEDLIPTSILSNTIKEVFIDLELEIPGEIIINEGKCFYGQLKESLVKNKIKVPSFDDFKKIFKNKLLKIVKDETNKILNDDKKKIAENFRNNFPKYTEFLDCFMNQFDIVEKIATTKETDS